MLARVGNDDVPHDLSLSKHHAQHLLASVQRARELLNWRASNPGARGEQSALWHLANSQLAPWTTNEQEADAAALSRRTGALIG